MRRRDFIKTTAAGALAGSALAGCGSDAPNGDGAPAVQTRPTVRWRLASSYPRSLDVLYGTTEVLARRVEALTDGRFQIRPYQAGELVPALDVLGAVQGGSVQMGHSASYYYTGMNPALAFDATVPFGLTARQHMAWMYDGGGLDLMRSVFSDFGVVNLPGGNTGAQMGGWFREEIGGLSDLRGLKMRIPGLGGEVMSELGVTAQVLPGSESFSALERGALDAVEWVGPYDDEKLGFHQVARHYYYPGWWEPGPGVSFYINQQAWDQLPAAYQEALRAASTEATTWMLAQYDARNAAALQRLRADGVQLHRFPDDLMKAAYDTSAALLADRAAADPAYRRVYDAYQQWRRPSFAWFDTAEQAYASFAFRT